MSGAPGLLCDFVLVGWGVGLLLWVLAYRSIVPCEGASSLSMIAALLHFFVSVFVVVLGCVFVLGLFGLLACFV